MMDKQARVKHIWDQAAGEFIPVRIPRLERIRYRWARVQEILTRVKSWPWIRKAAALAAIMRIYQIGSAAFWYDEGVSVVFARLPWDRMIAATAGDVHPPGYYIILWVLARTGIPLTEITARIPSILFSIAAVYLAAILARKLGLNERGQMIVTAWVVISPLQLHYAQEARMYALLQLEILAAIIFILDRRRAFLSGVLILGMYTHNYTVFYLPSLCLAVLVLELQATPRPDGINKLYYLYCRFKPWILAFIIPVIVWIPWLVVLLKQMGTVAAGYWIQPVKLGSVIFVIYQMLFAYSMPVGFQGLAILVTCGLMIYTAWRIYQDRPSNYLLLIVLTAAPLLLSVVLSILWKPVLLFRGLIGTTVPLTILVVKAIEGIHIDYKKYYAYAIIGITLMAGIAGHYLYNAENKGITTTWVHEIRDRLEDGDVIVSLNDNGIIAVMTYGQDMPLYKLENCGEDALGSLSHATRAALNIQEKSIEEILNTYYIYNPKDKFMRVWFISTVAPVSPECEIAAAAEIIESGKYRVELIRELSNTEYNQAGVYLVTSKEIY